MPELGMYEDPGCERAISGISFGRIDVGKTATKTVYLKNRGDVRYVDLEFTVSTNDVRVVASPDEIEPQGTAQLILEWKVPVSLRVAMKCEIIIKGAVEVG